MRHLFGFGSRAENKIKPTAKPAAVQAAVVPARSTMQPPAAAATSTLFTCVKNEGAYLLEWIAFHKVWGFDQIVIYDNGSSDETKSLLEPLARAGEIIYRHQEDVPKVPPQTASARDAAQRCTTTWIALLDADEFLVLHRDGSVNEFLSRFGEEISQVSINWRLFGSSGHKKKIDGLVIERFQMASDEHDPKNRQTKSITRTIRFQSPNVHAAFISGGLAVHPDGQPRWMKVQGIADRITHEIASVHHYVVKSREEFDGKIARGRGAVPAENPNKVRKDPDQFFASHDANVVPDTSALSRIAEVKAEMLRLSCVIGG